MKKSVLVCVFTVVGLAVLSYPFISNYLSEKNSSRVVDDYTASVSGEAKKQLDSEWDKAEIYNDSMTGNPVHDPFLEDSGAAMPSNYTDVLNVSGNGIMGTIEIPRINVSLPIYHGTEDDVLQKGVGHLYGSTMPIGGEGTHAVLSGHSGLPTATLFTNLNQLEKGDLFFLHILDRDLAYRVDQIKTVLPDNAEDLKIVPEKDYVTLVTCTPYGVNSHRLLVRGIRTAYVEKEKVKIKKEPCINRPAAAAGIGTAIIMLTLALITLLLNKRSYIRETGIPQTKKKKKRRKGRIRR